MYGKNNLKISLALYIRLEYRRPYSNYYISELTKTLQFLCIIVFVLILSIVFSLYLHCMYVYQTDSSCKI